MGAQQIDREEIEETHVVGWISFSGLSRWWSSADMPICNGDYGPYAQVN